MQPIKVYYVLCYWACVTLAPGRGRLTMSDATWGISLA